MRSLITQSTPLTVTQRSVVGPGVGTPQRRMTADGSPHAAVAWLVVVRNAASPSVSGIAIISGAHAGFAASGAGSTETAALHAESEAPSTRAEVSAVARTRTAARRRLRGMVLLRTWGGGVSGTDDRLFQTTRLGSCARPRCL